MKRDGGDLWGHFAVLRLYFHIFIKKIGADFNMTIRQQPLFFIVGHILDTNDTLAVPGAQISSQNMEHHSRISQSAEEESTAKDFW